MNITEFLLARIAEDEAAANAVDLLSSEMETISTHYLPEFADYMLRWQPNSIRAECAAKRAIIDHAKDVHDSYREDQFAGGAYAERIVGREGWVYPFDLSPVLGALAAVYKDHPEYKKEWGQG